MALTNIIRRAASRAMPLAAHATRSQRYYHQKSCSTLFATATRGAAQSQKLFRNSLSSSALHHDSTKPKADDTLLKIINSQIKVEVNSEGHDETPGVPESFPYKIEDEPGKQTLTLTRDYQDESISVEVCMPNLITGEECDSENKSQLPMVVRVSKNHLPCLEFGVIADLDKISINGVLIKNPKVGEGQIAYEGPDFCDLAKNIRKAFHKYLYVRGIKARRINFLHEYMIHKDSREYVGWLKNLKEFVEA